MPLDKGSFPWSWLLQLKQDPFAKQYICAGNLKAFETYYYLPAGRGRGKYIASMILENLFFLFSWASIVFRVSLSFLPLLNSVGLNSTDSQDYSLMHILIFRKNWIASSFQGNFREKQCSIRGCL